MFPLVKELVFDIILVAFCFLLFLTVLIYSLKKRTFFLKSAAWILFFVFIGISGWTAYRVLLKTYKTVSDIEFNPTRSDSEIYQTLLGKPLPCVQILQTQDQIIPKIDVAIFLHATVCPEEIRRISSKFKLNTTENYIKPTNSAPDWFRPRETQFISIQNISADTRSIKTCWINQDSTEIYYEDIFD